MSRLIDADRLHREIMELAMAKDHVRIAKIINMVEIQPTVDVAPARHGRWEVTLGYDPARTVMCDQCHKMAYEPSVFCPHCGAKMDGGETDGP